MFSEKEGREEDVREPMIRLCHEPRIRIFLILLGCVYLRHLQSTAIIVHR